MTFRLRLALLAALAVAATVATASGVVYVVMRQQLWQNLDQSLAQQWTQVQQNPALLRVFEHDFAQPFQLPSGGPRTASMYMQAVAADGRTQLTRTENAKVPVTKDTLAVAAGTHHAFYTNATVGGVSSRVFTVRYTDGVALQFVGRTADVAHALGRLRLILLLVVAGGLAVGAAGGWLVSRAALLPVRRLTRAAERIAETGDPSERVPVSGRDELSRLGTSFNTMLAALEGSLETQRRFVADASHELRTPLTSLQTNIEVLRQGDKLPPADRERLLADLQRESHEMRALIADLLELARGEDPRLERERVQLDEVVEDAVERARSLYPQVDWRLDVTPTVVDGYRERLQRAVWNLLENAGKWSGEGKPVEVRLGGGELRVRDYGPGIAADDLPHVFDRFYRSPAARAMPGLGSRALDRARGGRGARRHRGRRGGTRGRRAPAPAPERRPAGGGQRRSAAVLAQAHLRLVLCGRSTRPSSVGGDFRPAPSRSPARTAPGAPRPASSRSSRSASTGQAPIARLTWRASRGGTGSGERIGKPHSSSADHLRHELGAEAVPVAGDRVDAEPLAHRTASGRRDGRRSTAPLGRGRSSGRARACRSTSRANTRSALATNAAAPSGMVAGAAPRDQRQPPLEPPVRLVRGAALVICSRSLGDRGEPVDAWPALAGALGGEPARDPSPSRAARMRPPGARRSRGRRARRRTARARRWRAEPASASAAGIHVPK